MVNIKLRVNWLSERVDDNDNNEGKHFGIYIFDCPEEEFDEELGYGVYSVLKTFWFANEKERDTEFNITYDSI